MTVRLRRAQPAAHDSAIERVRSARYARRAGLAGLLLVAGAAARPATITCPPILLETPVVNSMLSGWDVDVRAGRRTLADAAIHLSRGSDRGGVAPDVTRRAGAQEMSSWTLEPGDGDVYWVACSYGNTSALLLQKVPETARRCVAIHDVLNSGRHLNVRPVECD